MSLDVLAYNLKRMISILGLGPFGCVFAFAERFAEAIPLLGEGGAGFRVRRAVWLLPFNQAVLAIACRWTGSMG